MRLCIEKSKELDPFYLDELLSFLGEAIKDYNWVFSDVQAHVFSNGNEITLAEFGENNFMMTGNELDLLMKKYNILFIFGVIMCVNNKTTINDIEKFPIIVDNDFYWSKEYKLSSENIQMEFGLFDTTVVVVTSNNLELIHQMKKTFINLDTLDSYLERVSY